MKSIRSALFKELCIVSIVIVQVILNGCTPPVQTPPDKQLCPGKKSVFGAIKALNKHAEKIKSMRTDSGTCIINFYNDDGKPESKRATVHFRFVPPDKLYFMCEDLGIRILIAGTNTEQFWFSIKPKEVSMFWFGERSKFIGCEDKLLISPENLLEGLGIVTFDGNWTLKNVDGMDVLTKLDGGNKPVKKVYVEPCEYFVSRIEYYNDFGEVSAAVELSDYQYNEKDDLTVPGKINFIGYQPDEKNTSIELNMKNIRLFEPTERQLTGRMFKLPPYDKYEHVYELADDCEFIKIK